MANVVCLLKVESDLATFTWSDGPASFSPYCLKSMKFKNFKKLATEARERLKDLVGNFLHYPDKLPQSSYDLALVGHKLYRQIFDPGPEEKQIADEVCAWLTALREQKGLDNFEIVVDDPWSMPWNVIYDTKPDEAAFLNDPCFKEFARKIKAEDEQTGENEQTGEAKVGDEKTDEATTEDVNGGLAHWNPFWGIRFDLTGGRSVSPLRRMPVLKNPKLLMVVDPEIRDGLPDHQQKQFKEFIQEHQLTVVHSADELRAAVKDGRPDLLYWLSHATKDRELVLGKDKIPPLDLHEMLQGETSEGYSMGGLAFLNACQTAEAGEDGSFFDAFHELGFSGMVGTEQRTINTFANQLGLKFLEEFFLSGKPIGEVMRGLRRTVPPLGLLYGTYCPPGIRVERMADAAAQDEQLKPWTLTAGREAMLLGENAVEVEAKPALHAEQATFEDRTRDYEKPGLPDEPYRSLAFFRYEDRALFAGREQDIDRFAAYLDDADTRILVLHGESGVGKSSFLRAGLIPFLEGTCHGYKFMRARSEQGGSELDDKDVLFVRATKDVFSQLARALHNFCATPYTWTTPTGQTMQVDLPQVLAEFVEVPTPSALHEKLRKDPTLPGRLLSAISARLPYSPILVIDQCEEIFTLTKSDDDENLQKKAVDMLRQTLSAPGNFKIILALRTEYYGRLIDRLRRGVTDVRNIREYLLSDFDELSLVEAIRRPTLETKAFSSKSPREEYKFYYEDGFEKALARDLIRHTRSRRNSVLPLMQVVCSQLYQDAKARKSEKITKDDLARLGGVGGGMELHVQSMLNRLLKDAPSDEPKVKEFFTWLYRRQPDGSLTTEHVPEKDLAEKWPGRRIAFDEFIAGAQRLRLLRVESGKNVGEDTERYVSLGHDALAKLAAKWHAKLKVEAARRAEAKKRNKFIVIAAMAVIIAAIMVRLERKATFAEQEARKNFETARNAVNEFYVSVSDEPLFDSKAMSNFKQQLLNKGQAFYRQFVSDHENDKRLRADVALAYFNQGLIKESSNDLVEARSLYCNAIEKQLDVAPDYPPELDTDVTFASAEIEQLRDLAKYYVRRGWVMEQTANKDEEKLASAKQDYGEAELIRSLVRATEPQNPEYVIDLASVIMNIGLLEQEFANWDDARARMEEAQAMRLQTANPDWDQIGLGYYNLAQLDVAEEKDKSRYAQAWKNCKPKAEKLAKTKDEQKILRKKLFQGIWHFEKARDAFQKTLVDDPTHLEARYRLAICQRSIAAFEAENGSLDEAQGPFLEALASFRMLTSFNPSIDDYRRELANLLFEMSKHKAIAAAAGSNQSSLLDESEEEAKKLSSGAGGELLEMIEKARQMEDSADSAG